jgi:hypothetical protein
MVKRGHATQWERTCWVWALKLFETDHVQIQMQELPEVAVLAVRAVDFKSYQIHHAFEGTTPANSCVCIYI